MGLNSMKEDEAQIGRPTGSGEGRAIHSNHVPRFPYSLDFGRVTYGQQPQLGKFGMQLLSLLVTLVDPGH